VRHVLGCAQGGARVAGCRLHPDVVEGPFPPQTRIADAVERHAAGQRKPPFSGLLMHPPGEVEHDFLEAALDACGEVGVFCAPFVALADGRRKARPVEPLGPKASVLGRVERFAQLAQPPRLAIGGERHHLVLVGRSPKAEVCGQLLVDEAERVGEALLGEHLETVGTGAAGQLGRPLAASVQR
jgi:hypothetical protein